MADRVALSFRLPPDVHKALLLAAAYTGERLNGYVVRVVSESTAADLLKLKSDLNSEPEES